ncbi:MAG: hypothetical protein KatS3mg103_1115 [Phycisphaerales bacterium]|nr:MAG: hypothetical protein KatS3mg103_1115 [Phycisphaerales bacterium]
MQAEAITMLAQFGMAGLIAWMWLTERRAGLQRERQIEEAHRALAGDRESLGVLLSVVEANTRAMVSLELAQRELAASLRDWRNSTTQLAHGSG